jgi:hypothetical protein
MKKQMITDSLQYVTSKNFIFDLDEDSSRQFGVIVETIDLYDATREDEHEEYPIAVSFAIVADKVHKSFQNEAGLSADVKLSKLDLIGEAYQYMGGVPIDHVLLDEIRNGTEASTAADQSNFDLVASQFSALEAKVCSVKSQFGTVAAQRGSSHEFRYLMFKNEAAAAKYVDYIIENRVSALKMLIGFILDRPINMVGNDGWETIRSQVFGPNAENEIAG